MLTVVTWWWGDKFGADYVIKLAAGVRHYLQQEHRFVLITDDVLGRGVEVGLKAKCAVWPIPDKHLLATKGCFARLRMFDPKWQKVNGVKDRLVCIDLDTVITGPLDPLFYRPEPFVIMQGGNAVNPCPYNGALMMLRPGAHPEVWNDFSLEAAGKAPFHRFPDDQGWIWHKVPNAAGWKCGAETGVYVYQKPGWPGGRAATGLPEGARLVTFINRAPSDLMHLGWVKRYWQ